jgi:hypothetical protein
MISGYPIRILKDEDLPEGRMTFPINVVINNAVTLDPSNVVGNLRFSLPAGLPVPPFGVFTVNDSYLVGRFFAQASGSSAISQLRSIQVSGYALPELQLFIWMPSIQRLITIPNSGYDNATPSNKLTTYFNFAENIALAGNAEIDIIVDPVQLTGETAAGQLSMMVNNFSVRPYFSTAVRSVSIP